MYSSKQITRCYLLGFMIRKQVLCKLYVSTNTMGKFKTLVILTFGNAILFHEIVVFPRTQGQIKK